MTQDRDTKSQEQRGHLLRVLLVEDTPADAELNVAMLKRAGYSLSFDVVDSPAAFQQQLERSDYDIILSDHNLRTWTGMEALEIVQRSGKEIPFVVVTATLGDEAAVEYIKQGASEYILKDRLAHLPVIVQRALEETALREERRRAEDALRKSEEKYRMVLQNIQEIVYIVKPNGDPLRGSVEFVSQHVRDVVGYEPSEFLEDPTLWFRLLHPDDIPAVVQATGQIIATRQAGIREYRIRHKETDEYHWIEDSVTPQFDDLGNLVATFGVARDVNERRRLEMQLLQVQKMEAIGRLAGGVAHDFNNHLNIILGYSDLLLERLAATDPLRRDAQLIRDAASRSASLTKQLLAFSRHQIFELVVVDLNAVISALSKMLRPLLGEDIELSIRLDPALGRVKADPGQIDQILMNLAANARDAMPKGGKLIIETSNAELDDSYAHAHFGAQPGSYAMLAVTDTGMGMDEETQARVFEPFFTTKERDKGTGLGLATVYGIVKQSGGYIWVYSEPGHGTTFKVYLPRVESSAEVEKLAGSSDFMLRGSETILLAEDSEELRELTREFLEHYGYRVLDAVTGAAALEVAEHHRSPIHLLITDVVMPGISGRKLADRLLQLRPELKVLYMSGYTDNVIVERGVLLQGIAFLQKPFTREALARKVREVLNRQEMP